MNILPYETALWKTLTWTAAKEIIKGKMVRMAIKPRLGTRITANVPLLIALIIYKGEA